MKKDFLAPLAKAAYEERCEAVLSGTYPERVMQEDHFTDWDEMPIPQKDAIQRFYRHQAQEVLEAFFDFLRTQGSLDVQSGLWNILYELKDRIFTKEEQISMGMPQGQEMRPEEEGRIPV